LRSADFDHLPVAQDDDALAHQPHHLDVVTDQKVGEAEISPQPVQQLQNRGLHRNVQGRSGLVEDEQARLRRQTSRDADARLLAAGQ